MKSSFRWYGESDPVKLEYIRQIPGMRSIVSAVCETGRGVVGRKYPALNGIVQRAWFDF